MPEPSPDATVIRIALHAAAATFCEGVRTANDVSCHSCRAVARDVVLTFLDSISGVAILPLELRLRILTQGADA